ncbi:MAG: NADH-ubiquinone oxidoreductase-F iron-sulfur binding region domain-containing protein [Caldicoprobacterales bacterium]|jgi:NADH-quinone oxidoreductase subunit F|nr:FAD-dependent oxidoreductase [Clostridiales bacterium]
MRTPVTSIESLEHIKNEYNKRKAEYQYQILVCAGAGCISSDCESVKTAVIDEIKALSMDSQIEVYETGCMGTCAVGPVMLILPERIFYTNLTPEAAKYIIRSHVMEHTIPVEYTFFDHTLQKYIPHIDDISFFREQVRIALRNCGILDYSSIDAYIAANGYFAAALALTQMSSEDVIREIKLSGLRGRGGAGFPTGLKWEFGRRSQSNEKYIVCNADEGDPGAFMDRSIIEGDPHTLIEGMLIGGYAIGANKGFVYVRAEYPLAVERLANAIDQARDYNLLGSNILNSGFSFDLEIRIGAGAFVCGEETSLMSSIEGDRGEPRQKPPYPTDKGLFGKPTVINNVETLASIPKIIEMGGKWYTQYGMKKAPGTKVFALAGNIVNTGIIEVPIGMPLGEIIYKIGGGIPDKKQFKAAQIGGPSGGCVTQDNLNVQTDYESLSMLGAIMGSGGLIVMNEDTCMVDTARYFMEFIRDESCGKCAACRVGTKRMLEILEQITQGNGQEGDIELLEELGSAIQDTAMCGLGQTAPNPVLSTIKYFREEYEEHIKYKHCRAGICSDLFISPCENSCPANVNIPGYISLIAAGRFIDAYNLIRQENPLPAVCGRICTHPCESRCRRGSVDEPVAICDLKRFVSDYAMKNEKAYVHDIVYSRNGQKVAIIGAGASGLTCGYYLARTGYEVDIYEKEPVAGGVLAFGIPEYRLPSDILQHEVDLICRCGVNIHTNTEVGVDIGFKELRAMYDAVYVATGTQIPQKVNVPGENLRGVLPGISFLKDVKLYNSVDLTNKVVAVIGGGNTAIDSARTAVRLGAKKVMILYRRTRQIMPAYDTEIEEALHEGVEVHELVSPVRFVSDKRGNVAKIECVRRQISNFDNKGRRNTRHIEGSNFFIDVDNVIIAVSQYADLPFVKKEEIGVTSWGTFITDPDTQMTTMPGVFAGGDVTRGSDEVIRAIADGKNAARSIDLYLNGKGILNKGEKIDIPEIIDEDELVSHERFPIDLLPLEQRGNTFDEVVVGYHKLNAIAEAMRCLHCNRR